MFLCSGYPPLSALHPTTMVKSTTISLAVVATGAEAFNATAIPAFFNKFQLFGSKKGEASVRTHEKTKKVNETIFDFLNNTKSQDPEGYGDDGYGVMPPTIGASDNMHAHGAENGWWGSRTTGKKSLKK